MESERYSIVLHTDAEQAVRNLVGGVSSQFSFQVRKASNQQHQSVGAAERGVRRLKETLAVLRADLNRQHLDIRFDKECIGEALNYLALSHNHYGKTRETSMYVTIGSFGRKTFVETCECNVWFNSVS